MHAKSSIETVTRFTLVRSKKEMTYTILSRVRSRDKIEMMRIRIPTTSSEDIAAVSLGGQAPLEILLQVFQRRVEIHCGV
jgi:hypothetical protein